jgi:hypothetical protein
MKTILAVMLTVVAALALTAADKPKAEKLLRHVVMFKFKDTSKPADVQQVVDAFAALPGKIDTIVDFEWGTDVGVENLSQGFTHCFLVTFKDAKGRETYLPHPAHEDFKKIVGPHVDKVLVFDYWSER